VLAPPFNLPILIKGSVGCSNAPPYNFEIENKPEKVSELFEEYIKKHSSKALTDVERSEFSPRFLGIKKVYSQRFK
jgi:hypothetical protein